MSTSSNASSGRLAARRILITGGASGIGEATVRRFASEGARIAVLDRDEQRLAALGQLTGVLPIPTELADATSLSRAVEQAARQLGGIDGVVNCAGVAPLQSIEAMTLDDWNTVLAINLTAPFLICKLALPWLKKDGGSIVNIASGVGLLPGGPNSTAYSGSKGGLIAFTKALAAEVAPLVRANVICPGLTRTPMTEFLFEAQADGAAPRLSTANYALQRAAEPDELANAILFLISNEASFITGSTLVVDGGRIYH